MKQQQKRELKIFSLKAERKVLQSKLNLLLSEVERIDLQLKILRIFSPQGEKEQRRTSSEESDSTNFQIKSSDFRTQVTKILHLTRKELSQQSEEFQSLLQLEETIGKFSDQELRIYLKKNRSVLAELLPTLIQKLENLNLFD